MRIEQHIEELRAKLRVAHPDERQQVEVELGVALAEREIIMAEQEGRSTKELAF